MPGIKVRENEGFDSAMRRFKRIVEKSGILSDMRRREFHETPSEKKKRALAAAIKRFRKKQLRDSKMERDRGVGRTFTSGGRGGKGGNAGKGDKGDTGGNGRGRY